MHGQIWEWCQDWYDGYPRQAVCDPTGPEKGIYKVARGGGWYFYAASCRSACRNYYAPARKEFFLGLRLVKQQ